MGYLLQLHLVSTKLRASNEDMSSNEDHFAPLLYPENGTLLAPEDAIFVGNGSQNTLGHVLNCLYGLYRAELPKIRRPSWPNAHLSQV
jgi:hypothetical protein